MAHSKLDAEVKSLIQPIGEERQNARGWKVTIDGAPVSKISHIVVDNARFGVLAYGLTPGGYDGWSFREVAGGGVVILPFILRDGGLHVGLVRQHRHNQGGDVWNAPRGFVDPGETHEAAGAREFREETGVHATSLHPRMLSGEAANPNSAFFETPLPGMGVRFAAVELGTDDVELRDGRWVVRRQLVDDSAAAANHRRAEMIASCQFFPWHEAACFADMFTNAAVARLLAHLHGAGRLTLRE
ncbi:MAG: NUDIX domain-containing protein [Polyangiaceae bacterium]